MPGIRIFLLGVCSLWATSAFAQSESLLAGIELFQKGDYRAAEKHFEKALNEESGYRARTFLALTWAATSRCEKAIPELKTFEHIEDAELRRLGGLGLARCYVAKKRFADAFPVLYRLKQLHPSDEDVLYETARAQMKAWNGVVQEMFDKIPSSFRVNQLSAEIFEIQGKYKEAIREYRKALGKSPHTLNLHYRLGRAILMESHGPEVLAEARAEFEAELKLNPNDAVAEYQVAQILIAQQKPDAARPHLERSAELDPNFPEALVALARDRLQSGGHAEAIRLLERAVALAPQSEAAHYSLMLAYRNAGRREDALRQKRRLDELQRPPEGEFTEFLKRIGESAKQE